MQSSFAVFAEHTNALDVRFLTKLDRIASDEDICRVLGSKHVVGLRQMHGNTALVVREASSRILEADAVVTDVPGLILTVRFADCQGLTVYAPKQHVVALIHAGWKGMCAKVITNTFRLLASEWGVVPEETLVYIGPSLCTSCADFTNPHAEAPELKDCIQGSSIDLQAASEQELLNLGVRTTSIERHLDCTRCKPDLYWTYRGGDREKVGVGNVNVLTARLL